MILNGNLYRIHKVVCDGDSATVRVELLPSHPIYAGHFPGRPVLPGVCTLTIIKECIGRILGQNVSYASIKECKYISTLIPAKDLFITISLNIYNDKNVKATVYRDNTEEAVLKLKAVIR